MPLAFRQWHLYRFDFMCLNNTLDAGIGHKIYFPLPSVYAIILKMTYVFVAFLLWHNYILSNLLCTKV